MLKVYEKFSALLAVLALWACSASSLYAQFPGGAFRWAESAAAGTGESKGFRIVADAVGNSYAYGMFENQLQLGSHSFNSAGQRDFYLVKYDVNGQVAWARAFGGGKEEIMGGLAIHGTTGDLYVSGTFVDEMTITAPNRTESIITERVATNNQDLFIAKFASNGDFLWVTKAGSPTSVTGEQCWDVAVDGFGNCYASGSIRREARFFSAPSSGGPDVLFNSPNFNFSNEGFVCKYTPTGRFEWVRAMGGPKHDYATSIAAAPDGRVFVMGYFDGTGGGVTIDGQSVNPAIAPNGLFIAGWQPNGTVMWSRAYRATGDLLPSRIVFDATGALSFTSDYMGSVEFGGPLTLNSTLGSNDAIMGRISASGAIQWAMSGGGPNDEAALTVACDAAGNSYFCGGYQAGSVFGPFNIASLSLPAQCHYLIKIDPSGAYQWIKNILPWVNDLAVTPDGCRIYGAGQVYPFPPITELPPLSITSLGNPADLMAFRYDLAVGGRISPPSIPPNAICRNSPSNAGTLQLIDFEGSVTRWESSTDCANFSSPVPISNTTASLPWANLPDTTCFRAVVRNGNCEDFSEVAKIRILQPPVVSINPPGPLTLCPLESVQLTASGAVSYSWISSPPFVAGNLSAFNIPNPMLSASIPTLNAFYIVEGTGVNGCSNTAFVDVTVKGGPPVFVSVAPAGPLQLCEGEARLLNASGANSYVWTPAGDLNNPAINDPVLTAATLGVTTYTVTGTRADGCTHSASVSVTVNPKPAVSVTPPGPLTLCTTQTQQLQASGAIAYFWSPLGDLSAGNIADPVITASTLGTTNYRVTGTGANGCTNSASVSVLVNSTSSVSIAPAGPLSVCAGSPQILTAMGANSYLWSPAANLSAANVAAPIFTGPAPGSFTYTVTGTTINGCTGSAAVTITVTARQNISVTGALDICEGQSTVLTGVGATGLLQWQRRATAPCAGAWVDIPGQTNLSFTTPVLMPGSVTCFRLVADDPICLRSESPEASVNLNRMTVGGTATAATPLVCVGVNSGRIDLSGETGLVVRWEESTDNVNWTPVANTNRSLMFSNLSLTTWFRAVVESPGCGQAFSTAAKVDVIPGPLGGDIGPGQSLCAGARHTFNLTGHSGSVLRWEFSFDNFTTVAGSVPNTTPTLLTPMLLQTVSYRAVVGGASCPNVFSNVATLTVNPGGGRVTPEVSEYCGSSLSRTLSATAFAGNILRWERSTDCAGFSSPTPVVAPVGPMITVPAGLTQTTCYRMVTDNPSCPFSTPAEIRVNANTVGGTLSGAPSVPVCAPTGTITLTLNGHAGDVVRWERSTDMAIWQNAGNVGNTTLTLSNLTATVHYRVRVQNGLCAPQYSQPTTISIAPSPVAGSVVSPNPANACAGASGILSLVGHSGQIRRWESSTDNFASVVNTIATTNPFIQYNNLLVTTSYRAVLGTLACPEVRTASFTVTITPPTIEGTLSGAATVCSGGNGGVIALSGHTGSVVHWEASTNNFASATTFANTTAFQNYNNLTATTRYRALVRNGVCPARYTAPAEITVMTSPLGGTLSGPPSVCGLAAVATLSLNNFRGQILHWESSVDNFVNTTTITHVAPNYDATNIAVTTRFRVAVGMPGCGQVYSNAIEVQSLPPTVGGNASASPAFICENATTTLLLNNSTGSVVQWERSLGSCTGVWEAVPNSASALLTTQPLIQTACYRAQVRNGSCPPAFSTPQLVTVIRNFVTRIETRPVRCTGGNDGRIEIISTAMQGEYSIDNGSTFTPNSVFTGLSAGSYNVVVRDVNAPACAFSFPNVIIGQPAQLLTIVSVNPTAPRCNQPNTGLVDLTVSGGVQPYQFLWSNSSQSEDLVNVASGLYSVTITDGNGCERLGSATVPATNSLNIVPSVQNVRCNGGSDGSINLNVSGGTPPYSYNWSIGGPNSSSRTGLRPGGVSVLVVDATGCNASVNITITEPAPLSVITNATPTTCPSAPAGTATATPAGGMAPYNFLWSNGGTTSLISGLAAGAYTVTVTDANGCAVSRIANVTATQSAPPAPVPVASPPALCGSGSSQLSVPPAANTTFTWYGDASATNVLGTGTTLMVSPTATTTYYVKAADALNPTCVSVAAPVTVSVAPASVGGVTAGAVTVCSGNNSGVITLGNFVGDVLRWEASTNNFASVSQTFVSILPTQGFSNLTQTTSFRAVVKSGACPEAFSSATTVTVAPNCGNIVVNPSSLSFGTVFPACGSAPQSYVVSGTGLSGPISAVAPAGFELSHNAAGPYFMTLTFAATAGVVPPTPVFVRVNPIAAPGSYAANVAHSSPSVPGANVFVSATVSATPQTLITAAPAALSFGSAPLNSPSGVQSYQLTIQNPTAGPVSISVAAPFAISLSPTGPFSSSATLNALSCQPFFATVFVRFTPMVPGPAVGAIAHSNGSASFSLPVSGNGLNGPARPVVVVNPNWNSQADVDATLGPNQRTWQDDAFADLQDAVNATASGGRVILNGPTHFGDNVRVPRPMTIEGAGPGATTVRPRTIDSNTYPTGEPRQALDPAFRHKHGFVIQSHDVTIRDLTISGDPSLDCSERFGVGVINDDRTGVPYNNIRVENVRVEYVYSKGIQLYNTGTKHSIRNTVIDDVCMRLDPDPAVYPSAAGIFVNDPAEIEDNVITRAGTGVRVEGDFGLTAGVSTIRRNQISDMEATGVDADLRPATTVNNVIIAGNTITSVGGFGVDARGFDENALIGGPTPADRNVINIRTRPGRGPGVGLRLSYSLGAMVQNIEVNAEGLESGLWLLNNTNPNRRVRVTEASLRRTGSFVSNPPHGRSNGLFMSELGQYLDGELGESYAHLWDSEISGFDVGVFTNENALRDIDLLIGGTNVARPSVTIHSSDIGLIANGRSQVTVRRNVRTIRDNRIGAFVYGGELNMDGSRMANNQTAILVQDKPLNNTLFESYVTIENSLFVGNGANIDNRSQRPVQASFNHWGTNDANALNASMQQTGSGIDFSPWLDSPLDTDSNWDNGFDGDFSYVHIDPRSYRTGGQSHLQEAASDARVQRVFVHDGNYTGSALITRDLVLTNDGSAPQPELGGMEINGAGIRVRMEGSFNMASSLTLTNGLIEVQNNGTLQVNLGSVLTGGSVHSYVIGNFARQLATTTATDLLFPIGSNSAYRPATLNVTQQTNAVNTYMGRVNEPNPFSRSLPSGVTSASTLRSWTMSQSGSAPVADYRFTGAYGSDDPSSAAPSDMVLLKDEGAASTAWTNINGTAAGSPDGSIQSGGGFPTLGNFVLGARGSTTTNPPAAGSLNLTAVMNVTTVSAIPMWTSLSCSGVQYEVRYRVKGSSTVYSTATATNTFMQLSGLQHNTTYEVSVRGRCPNQEFTLWSTGTVTEFTTQSLGDCSVSGTPPAPGNVHVNMITARTAQINWRRATTSSTQGYIISFGDAQLNPTGWPQFVVCNPAQSFLVSGLTPGRTYGVRMRTNCSNCTTALSSSDRRSDWTPVQQFTTLNSRETVSQEAAQAVTVYPSPTSGQFTVRLDAQSSGETRLTLTDISGRVILDRSQALEAGRSELNFSLEGYAAGLYLLRVRLDGSDRFVKVVLE